MTDWLDDILDRHPGGEVPTGFTERVRGRIYAESQSSAPVLRPRFGSVLAQLAAAALLLAFGFWLGRGAPDIGPIDRAPVDAQVSAEEITELFKNQKLYMNWEFAVDEDIDLSLSDLAAGTWDPPSQIIEEE